MLYNDPTPSTDGLWLHCSFQQRVRHWLHGEGKLGFAPTRRPPGWWSQRLVYVLWDHPHWHKPEGDRWIAENELEFIEPWQETAARFTDGRE
jgi:hypothetical protein